jgi:hypothetical protein
MLVVCANSPHHACYHDAGYHAVSHVMLRYAYCRQQPVVFESAVSHEVVGVM